MRLSRRDFLKASSALAGAFGLTSVGLLKYQEAFAAEGASPPVVWLACQNCTGCTVSLLNTIYYATIDQLLTQTIDLDYHPQLMAVAGRPLRSPRRPRTSRAVSSWWSRAPFPRRPMARTARSGRE
jgi:Ni,Fe-hydrogenase I small subunit